MRTYLRRLHRSLGTKPLPLGLKLLRSRYTVISRGCSRQTVCHYHWAISSEAVNVRLKPAAKWLFVSRPRPPGLFRGRGIYPRHVKGKNAWSLDWRSCIIFLQPTHTPPTFPHLTRISQIGCDSPALAVGGYILCSLSYSDHLAPSAAFRSVLPPPNKNTRHSLMRVIRVIAPLD